MSRLQCQSLENRVVPSIAVQFNYDLDTNGFFASAERRTTIETAITAITSQLDDQLAAIPAPASAFDSWTARFAHPGTGQDIALPNITVPANTLIVFLGGSNIPGSTIGYAQAGFGVQGTSAWLDLITARGQAGALGNQVTDVGPWGGSITFDIGANWYNGTDLENIPNGQISLFLTAQHEFAHILGLGASDPWDRLINPSNATFVGPASQALFGGPVPLQDAGHFRDGLSSGGQPVVMSATQESGGAEGNGFTPLDYAALRDIGWQIGGSSPPITPPATPPVVPPVSPPLSPPLNPPIPVGVGHPYIVGAGQFGNGSIQKRTPNSEVSFNATLFGSEVTGGVRVAMGDVNGDGVLDLIAGAGPGGQPEVRVLNGIDGSEIYRFNAFESAFRGGVYVASGDFNRDGIDDLAITPDEGGGPRVRILSGSDGRTVIADFFGIDDPNFRGGARTGVGDVNNDGVADLLVGAGFGGGPRLAGFDGASLATSPRKLFADFFVLEQTLRNGVFLSAGDVTGDGFADAIIGGGPGGGPRVVILDGQNLFRSNGSQLTTVANFFAGDPNNRGGVRIATRDLDGDDHIDLITGSGPITDPSATGIGTQVTTYFGDDLSSNANPTFANQFEAYPGSRGGVFVG